MSGEYDVQVSVYIVDMHVLLDKPERMRASVFVHGDLFGPQMAKQSCVNSKFRL